ncbi:capsid decoration protein [Pseudomonas phage Dolphis]|nr:capsid decoration protein [Pseudomonas phage Dolphis]
MSLTRELPRYQCHKQVQALKIRTIIETPGGFELHFEDARFAPHLVDMQWILRHVPMSGGYLVVYAEGHLSYSPAAVFEAGYTLIDEEPARRGPPVGYVCVGGPHDGTLVARPDGETRFTATILPKPPTCNEAKAALEPIVYVDYVLQEHATHGKAWVCYAAPAI